MAEALYSLIERLTADTPAGKKLRRQFHDNPETVTKNLTPEAKKALYTMEQSDGGAICAYVTMELEAEGRGDEVDEWVDWFTEWDFPEDEYMPPEKLPQDCRHEGGQSYPTPVPYVYDIDPRTKPASEGTAEIQVIGQGFVSGRTRLELEEQTSGTKLQVEPLYSGVEGSFRCGHLWAEVSLAAGTYDIRVIITTGTDSDGNPVEWGPLPVRKDGGNTIVFEVT